MGLTIRTAKSWRVNIWKLTCALYVTKVVSPKPHQILLHFVGLYWSNHDPIIATESQVSVSQYWLTTPPITHLLRMYRAATPAEPPSRDIKPWTVLDKSMDDR